MRKEQKPEYLQYLDGTAEYEFRMMHYAEQDGDAEQMAKHMKLGIAAKNEADITRGLKKRPKRKRRKKK